MIIIIKRSLAIGPTNFLKQTIISFRFFELSNIYKGLKRPKMKKGRPNILVLILKRVSVRP